MIFQDSSRRRFIKATGASIAGASLAGCTSFGGGGSEYEPRIAAVTALTGPLAIGGTKVGEIAEMAVADANEKFSDNDPVEVTVEDSESNVQTTRNLVGQALDDGAVGISGTVSSDVGISMREYAMENEVPFVPSVAVNSDITQAGTEYVARTYGDVTQLAIGACEYMQELGLSNVSFLGADFTYPRTFLDSVKEYGGEYGVEIIEEQFVPLGTDNFNPAISNIDLETADALFHIYPGANATVLTEQLEQNNVYDSIETSYGGNTFATPSYADATGDTKRHVSFAAADRSTEPAQNFESRVREELDARPDIYHYQGYDSIRFLAEAIHQAEELTPQAVYDALLTTDYQTVTDNTTVDLGDGGYNAAFEAPTLRWIEQDGEVTAEVAYKSEPLSYR
ncbi:ABC transporter substrate-binding protein [Halobellus sp. GM3]|uniref:ABC transporter substrate-binding protein n=1 Tax=Halobellus sp. GM3 TaxID=3458410 RepID=UPI00403DA67B